MSLSQSKQIYDNLFLNTRIRWMGELGWSADEVRNLPDKWASYLGIPEYVENLKANTEFMLCHLEKDNVLTLLLPYRVTFSMEPSQFQQYLRDIAEYVGDGWQEAIMRQFYEDREHMIFRNLPVMPQCGKEQWQRELERLYYCSQGLYYIDW